MKLYMKLTAAIIAVVVVVASVPDSFRDSPKQHEIAALGQSLFSQLAPGSRFVTGGITKFEEDLRYNEASREDLEFLRSLGIRQGSSIINIGGLGDANLALAAAYLGATYIEYDLKKRNVDKFMRDMGVDSMEGSAKIIQGEFSSGQNSASKDIPDRSQDLVLILTGALSDPCPESNPEEVLREALRVIKDRGKIVIGSFRISWGFLGREKIKAQQLIERVLIKPEFRDKVRLIKRQKVEYFVHAGDVYEVEFVTPDQPAPSRLEAAMELRRSP